MYDVMTKKTRKKILREWLQYRAEVAEEMGKGACLVIHLGKNIEDVTCQPLTIAG